MHICRVPSFFFTKKRGWLYWLELGWIQPFSRRSVIYLWTSSSSCLLKQWYWWWSQIGTFGSSKLISCSMSLSGGNPEGGSKTSGNSAQIAYQWERSVVGADMGGRLDDDMPSCFVQASYDICMVWSGPGSASLTCRKICTVNVMAPGACANCT